MGQAVKLTSSEKECHFRAEANYKILIKDYEEKIIFFGGLTCKDTFFTLRLAICVNKINIVNFDFILTLR